MPSIRSVPRAAWLAAIAIVVAELTVRAIQAFGVDREGFQLGDLPLFAAQTALWATIAVVAVSNERTRRFGWLVVASSVLQPWVLGQLPGDVPWLVGWVFGALGYAIAMHLAVAFPGGRLTGRVDRAVVVAGYLVWIVLRPLRLAFWDINAIFPCGPTTTNCVSNLVLVRRDDALVAAIDTVTLALIAVLGVLALIAIARHARDARPAVRRAFVYVAVGWSIFSVMTFLDIWSWTVQASEVITFVQSLAAGLLWSALGVGFLAALLATRLSRGRVASLALELASGVPTGGLEALLARTLRDPTVSLAFPAPEGDGLVDRDGHPVAAPPRDDPTRAATRLERDGKLLALLIHDPAIDEGDPDLVPAVGSVAQMALVNERLSAQVKAQLEEVRASRARIVEATDAERRRVERELHDGAQQRLVALAMRLEAARASVADAGTLIDQTTAELGIAIDEVRQLARGLHPTILTESGLRAAVEALAERTPIPVTVDIPDRRYPLAVEATAYFVVAEALTNVAKYAGATGIVVRTREADGRLEVTVEDDGRGGADPAAGSGLRGLVDRVAAAGGRLHVDSPPGAGTRILAEVPVP